jgi:hypothetical protein
MCPIILKSGSLSLLEPSGPSQGLLYLYREIYLIVIPVHAKEERVAFKYLLRKLSPLSVRMVYKAETGYNIRDSYGGD